MRILVVGAGATGGYFGGRLALAGRDVTFLLRERRQQQLKQTGLILQTPQGEHVLQPKTLVAQEIDGPYDLILIAVKSFGLVQAIEDITPAVGPGTRIIPLLNGMRHIDMLRGRFGENNVTGGLCKINATLGPQGEIIQMTPLHQLYYGALDGNNDSRLQHIDRELSHCGFDTILCEDIITDLWEKWLLLSTLGAVTCLARGDTRQILMSSGGSTLLQGVFSEVLTTLAAEGYRERPANTAAIYATLSNQKTPMTSSMYRDMVQGNDVEAGQIIGDLAQRAERHHLAVPLLNAVWVHMQVYLQQRHTPSEK